MGPVEGISAGDQLYVARYILYKLSEEFNVNIVLNPKPLCNPWNGSGLHTNFSTNSTRVANGISTIHSYIEKMSRVHDLHLSVYGDNTQRLTGMCETSNPNVFTYGVGTRNTSIRIPRVVSQQSCGYLEDRRPASNADPYLVTSIIFQTSCLN
jgi:glutamine synthetase